SHPVGALNPGRRACERDVIRVGFGFRLVWIARAGARLDLSIGPTHAAERIGLTDQPRQFSQGIALAVRRRMRIAAAVVRRIRSVLISISHRDDASPSGKARRTVPTKEPATARYPHRSPCGGIAPTL